jgi:electron transfer flavoprotein alpha subunit
MVEVLVVVESSGGSVKKVTLELLTLARTLGEPARFYPHQFQVGQTG